MDHFKMGKFIAELRKQKGLTQEAVARRLGITSQAVSKWEKGVNIPDISFLKELSEILDVEVEERNFKM